MSRWNYRAAEIKGQHIFREGAVKPSQWPFAGNGSAVWAERTIQFLHCSSSISRLSADQPLPETVKT